MEYPNGTCLLLLQQGTLGTSSFQTNILNLVAAGTTRKRYPVRQAKQGHCAQGLSAESLTHTWQTTGLQKTNQEENKVSGKIQRTLTIK